MKLSGLDDIVTSAMPVMSTLPTPGEPRCVNATQLDTTTEDDSPDAFVYIVVVLSFYALAMTILMVKYIRRENQEAQLSYYFHEFINREKFNTPRYRNKEGVTAIKRTLNKFYQSMGLVEAEKDSPVHELGPPGNQEDSSHGFSDSGIGPEERLYRYSDSGLDLSSPRSSVQYEDRTPVAEQPPSHDLTSETGECRLQAAHHVVMMSLPHSTAQPEGMTQLPVIADSILPQLPMVESAV